MWLRPDQVRRYARHVLLPEVGGVGQRKLLESSVRVSRADGAGAVALVYLAAAGVGTLVVDDAGPVAAPDGFLYETADVGRPRCEAARERIAALNSDVKVLFEGDAAYRLDTPPAEDAIEALALGAASAGRLIEEIVR